MERTAIFPKLVERLSLLESGTISYEDLRYADTIHNNAKNKPSLRHFATLAKGEHSRKQMHKKRKLDRSHNQTITKIDVESLSHASDDTTHTLNCKTYLDQPDVVSQIISETMIATKKKRKSTVLAENVSVTKQTPPSSKRFAPATSPSDDNNEDNNNISDSKDHNAPPRSPLPIPVPQHAAVNVQLPLLRAVSPRTLRRIHRLPKPNEDESRKIESMQRKFEDERNSGEFQKRNSANNQSAGGLYGKIINASFNMEEKEKKLLSDFLTLTDTDKNNLKNNSISTPPSTATAARASIQKKRRKKQKHHQEPLEMRDSDSVSFASLTKTTASAYSLSTLDIVSLTADHDNHQSGLTKNRDFASLKSFYDPKTLSNMSDLNLLKLQKTNPKFHQSKVEGDIQFLREQLGYSQTQMNRTKTAQREEIHTAKSAGVVPEDMLEDDEVKEMHFEKGVEIVKKHFRRQIKEQRRKAFTSWITHTRLSYEAALLRAATSVQHAYRSHLSRIELASRIGERRIQIERENELIRLENLKLFKASTVIQSRVRVNLAKKKAQELKLALASACKIQCLQRIRIARDKVKARRAYLLLLFQSAARIQSCWRAYQQRKRYRVLKKIKVVDGCLALKEVKKKLVQSKHEDVGAAVEIQYAWRRRKLWQNLRFYVGAQKQVRAVRLQKAIRLFRAKREARRRRREKKRLEELKQSSCLLIQTTVRRFLATCYVDKILFEKEKAILVRRMEKVHALRPRIITLPIMGKVPMVRDPDDPDGKKWVVKKDENGVEIEPKPITIDLKQKHRDWIDLKRKVHPFTNSRENRKAVLIQKLFRGYHARCRIIFMRQMEKLKRKYLFDKLKEVGAVGFQRLWRGYLGRRIALFINHTSNCITVQKIVRGFCGRRRAYDKKRKKIATTVIQKQFRGYIKRTKYQQYRERTLEQQKPAKVIQRCARIYFAKIKIASVRYLARAAAEKRLIARVNIQYCEKRERINLLLSSVYSDKDRAEDGIFQEFFLHCCGGEHRYIENAHFIKLFKDAPGVIGARFKDFNTEKMRDFTVTDLDLMFSKKKSQGTKHLTYVQFVELLDVICATIFSSVKELKGRKGRDARMLEMVLNHLFISKTGNTFKAKLDQRLKYHIGNLASKLQSQSRKHRVRLLLESMKRMKDEAILNLRKKRNSILIQKRCRIYLSRCIAIKRAQKTYIKYIDPVSGDPYWSNPKTKLVTWAKPKIFGPFSDVFLPTLLPSKGTEFVVMCVNCGEDVCDVVCNACDDSFCRTCYNALHTKGNRKKHISHDIPRCRECKYQLASKTCQNCTAEHRQLCCYCDVCFTNTHNTEETHEHKYSWLVQCCVECRSYAARWRCLECCDVYCTACFSKVHKRGTRVNHICEPLTYYTPQIHEHYERDQREKNRQNRLFLDLESEREKRRLLEYKSATDIQRRWRGFKGRKRGLKHLKEGRVKIRESWRMRKNDSSERKKLSYRVLEPFALAKRLESDSMEEAVLKRVPFFMRKRAKYWIEQNLQDEYWFPEKITDKKKIPKRGFQVGTYLDLKSQAWYGGIRLPGVHKIKQGYMEIKTEELGLENFLEIDDRVRIGNRVYTVDKDTPVTCLLVPIDRAWRFDTQDEIIVYKKPKLHKYVALARKSTYGLLHSQIVQMGIKAGLNSAELFETLLGLINRIVKDRLSLEKAKKMKKFIEYVAKKRKRSSYFMREKQNRQTVAELERMERDALLNPGEVNKDDRRANAYLDDPKAAGGDAGSVGGDKVSKMWDEQVDEETLKVIWVNKETGEIRDTKPDEEEEEGETAQEEQFKEAQKRLAKMKKGGRKQLGRKKK